MKPAAILGLTVATAAAAGVASYALSPSHVRKVKPGRLLCPSEAGKSPASTVGIEAGDFIVVQLISGDRTFMESTWAQVTSHTEDGLVVKLTGELTPTGVQPLQTKRHGFRLGRELLVAADCVWDTFRSQSFTGRLLCGPQLAALDGLHDTNLRALGKGLILQIGDRVDIVVASTEANGTAWWEVITVTIVATSSTGQVLSGIVDDELLHSDLHGLLPGAFIQFNRDCVVFLHH